MSTIAPTAGRAIGERLRRRRRRLPRRAGVRLAAQGRGRHAHDHGRRRADEAFERARPLFEAMGERVVHVGPQGHGSLAKLLTNTMAAVHAVALAESVLAAERAGLDPDAFLEVAAGSAGNSTVLGLKGRPDVRARLRAAVQARAHAEGRAPLPRRGQGTRGGAAAGPAAWSRSTRRPRRTATARSDFAAVITASSSAGSSSIQLETSALVRNNGRPRPAPLVPDALGAAFGGFSLYASRFQGMGRDRARARRG